MHKKRNDRRTHTHIYIVFEFNLYLTRHTNINTARERERETRSDMLFDWAQGVGLSDDLYSSLQSH
jgi:hypothetical protein